MLADVCRRDLLRVATDLADHDDGMSIGIFVEQPDRIHEIGADDRISADTDASGLPDPKFAQLGEVMVRDLALYEAVSQSAGGDAR